jgi:hypothetical protein
MFNDFGLITLTAVTLFWIVGFGLSRVLIVLQLLASPPAYGVWFLIIAIDGYLLYLFFGHRQSVAFSMNRPQKRVPERGIP